MMLLSVNSIQAKPEIIDWKVFSGDKFNASDMALAYLFIDSNDKMFVGVIGREGDFLWLNNKWVNTDQYGKFLNEFFKDGRLFVAFQPYVVHLVQLDEKNIDIYAVDKDKDIMLEKRITSPDPRGFYGIYQIVAVSGEKDVSYSYILGLVYERSSNPIEYMKSWRPDGPGRFYAKPVLAEIQGQVLLKSQKIPYGGKINESYRIREVLTGKDTIHFLGFTQEQVGESEPSIPKVLHYAEYNVKKKKLVLSQDIYEKTPYFDSNDKRRHSYWHISADNFNDNIFIVFSWHGTRDLTDIERNKVKINVENINTPIYYSQRNGKDFSNVEVIGNGILPLVKADSLGNVHVIWSNSDGDLVHKAIKDGKWGDEQMVLDGVIDVGEVWEGMRQGEWWLQNMCAEFDKDNNLNIVFTSKGKLVYAKIRFN